MSGKIKKLYRKYREFITYFIVGCCTTALNFGLTYLCFCLIGDTGFNIVISNTIGWVISTTFGFFMYKLVVFRSKSMAIKTLLVEGSEFYGARLFSWGFESVGLYLLGNTLGFSTMTFAMVVEGTGAETLFRFAIPGSMIAKLIMTVFVTISNYIFSKFVIFSKNSPQAEESEEQI